MFSQPRGKMRHYKAKAGQAALRDYKQAIPSKAITVREERGILRGSAMLLTQMGPGKTFFGGEALQ